MAILKKLFEEFSEGETRIDGCRHSADLKGVPEGSILLDDFPDISSHALNIHTSTILVAAYEGNDHIAVSIGSFDFNDPVVESLLVPLLSRAHELSKEDDDR